MAKPIIAPASSVDARPYILQHCLEYGLLMDPAASLPYEENISWWGAFVDGKIEGVLGLTGYVDMPDTLYIYGIYGSKRALAALVHFLGDLPYARLRGHVLKNNEKMLRVWSRFAPKVIEYDEKLLFLEGRIHGRKVESRSKCRAERANKPN